MDIIVPHIVCITVAFDIIAQQSLIARRQGAGKRLLNGLRLPGRQIDPELFSQDDEIAPRMTVALGKLYYKLFYAGCGVGDDFLFCPLPKRYLSPQRMLQQGLQVWDN
jgi:hypothetical protein